MKRSSRYSSLSLSWLLPSYLLTNFTISSTLFTKSVFLGTLARSQHDNLPPVSDHYIPSMSTTLNKLGISQWLNHVQDYRMIDTIRCNMNEAILVFNSFSLSLFVSLALSVCLSHKPPWASLKYTTIILRSNHTSANWIEFQIECSPSTTTLSLSLSLIQC